MFLDKIFGGTISFFFKEVLSKYLNPRRLFPKDYAEKLSEELISKKHQQIINSQGSEVPTWQNIEYKLLILSKRHNIPVNLFYHPVYIFSGILDKIDEEPRLPYKKRVINKLQKGIDHYINPDPNDPNSKPSLGKSQFPFLDHFSSKTTNSKTTQIENYLEQGIRVVYISSKPLDFNTTRTTRKLIIFGIAKSKIARLRIADQLIIGLKQPEPHPTIAHYFKPHIKDVGQKIIEQRKEKFYKQILSETKMFTSFLLERFFFSIDVFKKESSNNHNDDSNQFELSHKRKKRFKSILGNGYKFLLKELLILILTSVISTYILFSSSTGVGYLLLLIIALRMIHLSRDSYFRDMEFFYWNRYISKKQFIYRRDEKEIMEGYEMVKKKEYFSFSTIITKEKDLSKQLINREKENHIIFKSSNFFMNLAALLIYLDYFMKLKRGKIYLSNKFLRKFIRFLNDDLKIHKQN